MTRPAEYGVRNGNVVREGMIVGPNEAAILLNRLLDAEREVQRLDTALTRAMDRGNELEIACDHHRMFWQHYERALKVIAEGRSPVPADRIAQGALSSLDSEQE